MSKRSFVAVMVVAFAVVLAAGGLLASNMGFKLNYQLADATTQGGAPAQGLNTLALPFNAESTLANTGDVRNAIGAAAVAGISVYVESTDSFSTYTGGKGEVAPGIVPGEGLFVQMNSAVNYVVVGSHNPSSSIPLENAAGQGGAPAQGLNAFAVPYHTTAVNTGDLRNDIGATAVAGVSVYVESADSFSTYTGGKGEVAPAIVPGEWVFVQMNSTVNYTPSHY